MNRRLSLLALGSVLALGLLVTNSGSPSAKAAAQAAEPAPIAGQGYQTVWGDEFDAISPSWGGKWWSPSTPANSIYTQNGVLHLVSRRSQSYPQVTISTETSSTGHWKQGYFEARMRWTKGAGAWPAFWLFGYAHSQGHDCPPLTSELDIFEGQGTEPTAFYGTLHRNTGSPCGTPDQQNNDNMRQVADLTAGWHVYAAKWTQTEVTWYLDDQEVLRVPVYDSTNQDMFLIFDMWIGGWANGNDPNSSTPDELDTQVDWVHVWQKGAAPPPPPPLRLRRHLRRHPRLRHPRRPRPRLRHLRHLRHPRHLRHLRHLRHPRLRHLRHLRRALP